MLKHRLLIKVLSIVVMTLLLMLPALLVQDLVHERESLHSSSVTNVSNQWGREQTITGPFITIPCEQVLSRVTRSDGSVDLKTNPYYLHLLPEELAIDGSVNPFELDRGVYEVVVYESELHLSGYFTPPSLDDIDTSEHIIHYEKAFLSLGLTDLKGLQEQVSIDWDGKKQAFSPGVKVRDVVVQGLQAQAPIEPKKERQPFKLTLNLNGSQKLFFHPMGKTTTVDLKGNWASPSFSGNFIPDHRDVTEEGFSAQWKVLHLNRHFPQQWTDAGYNLNGSAFGVDLFQPVDRYSKAHRVTRYAILFIACTFLVFFFVEVLKGVNVHPIQYLLVGISLVVFYLLLLSFSEFMPFNLAYLLGMAMTLGLIALYTRAVLKSKGLSIMTVSILLVLYGFIFSIIQMEETALIVGSIGVFALVATVMFISRKIDWYQLPKSNQDSPPDEAPTIG